MIKTHKVMSIKEHSPGSTQGAHVVEMSLRLVFVGRMPDGACRKED